MRRRAAKVRKIFPDAKYNEIIVSRFANRLMDDGKKSVVEKAIYEAFDNLEKTSALASVIAPPIPMNFWKVLSGTTKTEISVSSGCLEDVKTKLKEYFTI